jgi:ABC-type antimicrobial peptide transport system permease subunit
VGTDITVSATPTAPTAGATNNGGRQAFNFGAQDGAAAGGTRTINQARLVVGRGTPVFDDTQLATVKGISNVADAAATLTLNNISFSGQLPDRAQQGAAGGAQNGGTGAGTGAGGGADGAGGSAFSVNSFSVEGVDPSGSNVGPLTATTVTAGRAFTSADVGKNVVILDSTYATSASLAVGGTVAIAGKDFSIVGLVASNSSDATTASNTYIPLDVAQTLSTNTGKVTTIYVTAASSANIPQIQSDLKAALPDATVKTQADLAATVSGSLATASQLVSSLGTWLSIIVLAAAFLIAILFTISGVTRRTREFGTLKAIGWSNSRIVRQVSGESLVQGLIGGVIGVAVGLVGILIVNLAAPTLSGTASASGRIPTGGGAPAGGGLGGPGLGGGGLGGGGFGGAPGGGFGRTSGVTSTIALHAPVTLTIILIAVGLAVVGGILAGAIGGWRAARLRPAEALRSVA